MEHTHIQHHQRRVALALEELGDWPARREVACGRMAQKERPTRQSLCSPSTCSAITGPLPLAPS